MKWFLRLYFLLTFAVLPLTVHALPLPPSPPLPQTPGPVAVRAPEFDPGTVSAGMAVLVGSGWLVLRRLRRNRKSS
jgi:hypothetical protein